MLYAKVDKSGNVTEYRDFRDPPLSRIVMGNPVWRPVVTGATPLYDPNTQFLIDTTSVYDDKVVKNKTVVNLDVSDVAASVRSEVKLERDDEEQGGFTYLGKPFDSDKDAVMRITGAGLAALAAKTLNQAFLVTWTCGDDSDIMLDADQMLGLLVALFNHANAAHVKARAKKARIIAAAAAGNSADIIKERPTKKPKSGGKA